MKALERLISQRGVDPSKADTITRKLRETGHLPSGGRGPNAPRIGVREAATFLIAVAGSPKAIDAPVRVGKLAELPSGDGDGTLLDAIERLLADEQERGVVREVRIARTQRWATVVNDDRSERQFQPKGKERRVGRLAVEGVLDRDLLCSVSAALEGRAFDSDLDGNDD